MIHKSWKMSEKLFSEQSNFCAGFALKWTSSIRKFEILVTLLLSLSYAEHNRITHFHSSTNFLRLSIRWKYIRSNFTPHINFLAKWRYCWFELLVQLGNYFLLWLGSKLCTTTSKWLHYTRNYIWLWFAEILSIDSWPIPNLEHRESDDGDCEKPAPGKFSFSQTKGLCLKKAMLFHELWD